MPCLHAPPAPTPRYGGANDDDASSPATTASFTTPHTNSLPGSSNRSHSLRNSHSPSSASPSSFAQRTDATPTSLFAPHVAHQAAHAAASLNAQSPLPPPSPRIFDLSSLGASSHTARGNGSHSRSMSAGGERDSSPPAASDHTSPDHSAKALDKTRRVESGSKSRGGSPFLPPPALTAYGLEGAGGSYTEGSPSPSSQPLLASGSGRRMRDRAGSGRRKVSRALCLRTCVTFLTALCGSSQTLVMHCILRS
eukprot:54738-Pelagomonas_calceolata.AAC.1